jgi:MFS family permease
MNKTRHTDLNRGGDVLTVLNLSVLTFLVLLGLSMVSPILLPYAESFQVSYTLIGFVISSFAVTRMILDMPTGPRKSRCLDSTSCLSGQRQKKVIKMIS